MELPLLVLVLVSFCEGQNWNAPDFCRNKLCPQFTAGEQHQGFEERLYVPTEWITTKIDNPKSTDFMAANSRLKRVAGDASADYWPVLITVTNGSVASLSWFVPPNTAKPEMTDTSVTLQSRPEVTVYVRVFDGPPSINNGKENAKMQCDALQEAGKSCTDTYSFAGYDSYFSITHHNEVWFDKTQ
ncbi:hypothetical protein EPR50_G00174530 [Perca flavescens]|uniref:Heme-binding protein 2 n=1 Tax=Perca flavescens TaxID=8167 RepID=A0A484CBR5_PERFV|nr:hypothetical protein EPR50_G00174530 [Perca flavescens]